MAKKLILLIGRKDWENVAEWGSLAKAKLMKKTWLRSPFKILRSTAMMAFYAANRLAFPPGLVIALIGPDGSGKTTVGQGLAAALGSIFPQEKAHYIHWRPGLLPAPAELIQKLKRKTKSEIRTDATNPHALPPYSTKISFARFFYFWIDFVVGAPLRFRPIVARNGIVLIDRYYYDFLVDQRRYRLNLPVWLLRAASYFVPTPDVVFYLDAPTEVLLSRKQELPQAELQRQRDLFSAILPFCGNNAHIINVDRSLQEVVDEMRAVVFDSLVKREHARSKGL